MHSDEQSVPCGEFERRSFEIMHALRIEDLRD